MARIAKNRLDTARILNGELEQFEMDDNYQDRPRLQLKDQSARHIEMDDSQQHQHQQHQHQKHQPQPQHQLQLTDQSAIYIDSEIRNDVLSAIIEEQAERVVIRCARGENAQEAWRKWISEYRQVCISDWDLESPICIGNFS